VSAANRATGTFERAMPVVIVAAIVLIGYFWFIQPTVTEYLRTQTELTGLRTRVSTLMDTVNRGRGLRPADEAAAMTLFEARMSADDQVPEVVEQLATLALASAPKDRIRGLQISTGVSVVWRPGQASPASRGDGQATESPDPRLALFGTELTYTPVTVTFDGSYDAIRSFTWQLRDLPTIIELRSMELTRGLPLMRATIHLFVYQRGSLAGAPAPTGPAPGSAASPAAPRVARLSMAEGW
jgi:Tfp pilus assembly protein PilO